MSIRGSGGRACPSPPKSRYYLGGRVGFGSVFPGHVPCGKRVTVGYRFPLGPHFGEPFGVLGRGADVCEKGEGVPNFVTGAAVAGVARRSSGHLAARTEHEGGPHVGHKTVSRSRSMGSPTGALWTESCNHEGLRGQQTLSALVDGCEASHHALPAAGPAADCSNVLPIPLKALEFYCSEKNAQACGYQRVCQET